MEWIKRIGKGLAILPIGTSVATVVFLYVVNKWGTSNIFEIIKVCLGFLVIGLIAGSPFSGFLTCIVLPIARGPNSFGGWPMYLWLLFVGTITGYCVLEFVPLYIRSDLDGFGFIPWVNVYFRFKIFPVAGGFAGAACGILFAYWTPRKETLVAVP